MSLNISCICTRLRIRLTCEPMASIQSVSCRVQIHLISKDTNYVLSLSCNTQNNLILWKMYLRMDIVRDFSLFMNTGSGRGLNRYPV